MSRAVAALMLLQLLLAAWFLVDTAPGTDAALRGLPVDDAWIHLVYGRELLAGHPGGYNPGTLETGFTSPLQILVAAVAVAIAGVGVPVGLALKLLTLACTLPGTVLAGRLAARRAGEAAGWVAAALVALSPTVSFSQLSGMEVGISATLILGAWEAVDLGRVRLGGLVLAGAVLARPEAVLFVPVLLPRLRQHVWPVVLGLAAWAAYDLAVTGHPLPATFYAKAEPMDLRRLPVAVTMLAHAWPLVGLGVGPVLWLWACADAGRRQSWFDLGCHLFPPAWVAAVALGRLISPSDQYFYFLRYFLPIEPLFAVSVAVGFGRILALRHGRAVWLAMAAVFVFQALGQADRRTLYAWNCQNIEEMQGRVADWLRTNAPGKTVASVDAGLIRYRSEAPVRDVVGLNDHALLFTRGLRSKLLTDPAQMAAWMAENEVDYLFTFPAILPFTAPEAQPERWFDIALQIKADPYTIAGPTQSTAWLLHRKPTP